jgi:Helix-turn-helix domain
VSGSERILLDKKAAAGLLGIGVRTLDWLVQCGDVQPVRIGRRVLFFRESLETFARGFAGKRDRRNYEGPVPSSVN